MSKLSNAIARIVGKLSKTVAHNKEWIGILCTRHNRLDAQFDAHLREHNWGPIPPGVCAWVHPMDKGEAKSDTGKLIERIGNWMESDGHSETALDLFGACRDELVEQHRLVKSAKMEATNRRKQFLSAQKAGLKAEQDRDALRAKIEEAAAQARTKVCGDCFDSVIAILTRDSATESHDEKEEPSGRLTAQEAAADTITTIWKKCNELIPKDAGWSLSRKIIDIVLSNDSEPTHKDYMTAKGVPELERKQTASSIQADTILVTREMLEQAQDAADNWNTYQIETTGPHEWRDRFWLELKQLAREK